MTFDKTREALPWNAWKTVKGDVTLEKSFADEEDEEEKIRKYQQMSGYRKSFQVWLAEKAAQKAKEQSDAENEAKRLAENKTLEEMQRRMKAKTFDQWIREKDATGVQPKSDDDATDAEKEARRTQASLKYQEWMRKKDAEALEQEEVMRLEEQRKYEQLKKKREEESRTKWPRKTAIFKVNSLPVWTALLKSRGCYPKSGIYFLFLFSLPQKNLWTRSFIVQYFCNLYSEQQSSLYVEIQ